MTKPSSKTQTLAAAGSAGLFLWMFLFNLRPIQDPDIWWHLASGRWMVNHHLIPKVDVFSLTARGSAWINTYWLQELFLYLIVHLTGLTGLIVVKSLVVAGLVFWMARTNPWTALSWGTRLLGMVWIFLAAQPRGFGWEEKASLVTLGFLGLLFITLRAKSWASTPLYKYWPLLFFLWANMHRGFILGLAIVGLYVAELWLSQSPDRRRATIWGFGCGVVTLANPWGFRVFRMGWQDYRLSPMMVSGWAQTPFFHLELFWLTLALFWICTAWTLWRRRKLGSAFLATSAVLSALSLRYASLYPYFIIWAVPWLLSLANATVARAGDVTITIGTIGAVILSSLHLKPAFGINEHIFPVEAVDFLKTQNLRVPFFHEYALGGFYLWALEGNPPVLIDGRYPAVQGYQHLFPDMQEAIQNTPEQFQSFLDRFQISCAVLKYPSTQFMPSPFTVYFPRRQWALVYWDDVVLIFVRRRPEFQALIKQNEFARAQPEADPTYWRQTVWGKATAQEKIQLRADYQRNVNLHPNSRRTARWLSLMP